MTNIPHLFRKGLTATLSGIVFGGLAMSAVQAEDMKPGDVIDDVLIFIHHEQVETFGNSWYGVRVNNWEEDQSVVYVRGEGKTVEFYGVLSINCEQGGGAYWETGSNFGEALSEAAYKEAVPDMVMTKSREFFCG